jgi:hypothetical protein
MKRNHVAAATAVAAAVIATAALVPGAAGQDQPGVEPFTLTMRHSEAKVSMVDLPPKMTRRGPRSSESPGDFVVARAPVRDGGGRKAGDLHAIFTVTGGRGSKTTEMNSGTLVLPDGQLVAQGLFDNSRASQVDEMAILGGTGRYEGMRGGVTVTSGPREVTFRVRLRP